MKHLFSFTLVSMLLLLHSCSSNEDVSNDLEGSDSISVVTDTLNDLIETIEPNLDSNLLGAINQYLDAAIEGDIDYLADNTEFPIARRSPLPGWSDESDFENAYDLAFDDSLIGLFHKFQLYPDLIDRTGATGEVGILDGALWFTSEGVLTGFNYVAQTEEDNRIALQESIIKSIHPALKKYNYNLFTGTSEDYIIRVDDTEEKGLRYAQWSKSFTMSDEPDMMLYNGEWEQMGSGGGWQITFEEKEGPLVLKNVAMCETEDGCGYFLSKADGEKIVQRELDETKLLK